MLSSRCFWKKKVAKEMSIGMSEIEENKKLACSYFLGEQKIDMQLLFGININSEKLAVSFVYASGVLSTLRINDGSQSAADRSMFSIRKKEGTLTVWLL